MLNEIDFCPFTGRKATKTSHDNESLVYTIPFENRVITLRVCKKCLNQVKEGNLTLEYQTIINGLILNNRLHVDQPELIHWDENVDVNKTVRYNLKAEILALDYPKTPEEKLENLFRTLHKMQPTEGARFNFLLSRDNLFKLYFKEPHEFHTYFSALENKELVTPISAKSNHSVHLRFTFLGLSEFHNLLKQGYNSTRCFVAMSFDADMQPIRDAIVKAINDTGFTPIIVDKLHIDSDRTINDAIFAGLKECKFCIADFCGHKNGVYLEAGFALGLGKKVIYTCSKEQFSKAHFDIKPLQQILYESPEELTERLINKIKAWIV